MTICIRFQQSNGTEIVDLLHEENNSLEESIKEWKEDYPTRKLVYYEVLEYDYYTTRTLFRKILKEGGLDYN